MKNFSFKLILVISAYCHNSWSQGASSIYTTIATNNVILYERPTTASPVVRRVFAGEVLKIEESIKAEHGDLWGKVIISPNQIAYIQGVNFSNNGTLQISEWEPEEVLRSQMPFSFSLKGSSELFGVGLQARYLPFTRLGFTVGAGSILDSGTQEGSSIAFGLICVLSMKNFSPFVETGSATLTLNDLNSTLRISTFYVNAGVEWLFTSGYFIGMGVSYNRSYDIQLSYDYSFAKASNGNLKLGNYGSFNKLDSKGSLQKMNPLLIMGYSF